MHKNSYRNHRNHEPVSLRVVPDRSRKEEFWNALTHAIGVLFTICALPLLLYQTLLLKNNMAFIASTVFGFGMLMCFLSSTLYHATHHKKWKVRLLAWDQISIFFMIGGSYTPFVVTYTEPSTAIPFLSVLWTMIIGGAIFKLVFPGRYEKVTLVLYLVIGWMILFIAGTLSANMPAVVMGWIIIGGIAYHIGIVFYLWEKIPYSHSIWHCFVLMGAVAHFVAIYQTIYSNMMG